LQKRSTDFTFYEHKKVYGLFINGPAGLAHARLSIIDLSGGDQPIYNEDRTVWVVFNGEIFNYPRLRKELITRGHRFYTHSDTEVLVHLYEEYGAGMFAKLNGQFAFAIWDQKCNKLLLGRDRMGIRPLFYHYLKGRLVFGSEIKALFADSSISRQLDLQTLSDIFTCWSPLGTATAFNNIHQLPPAHYAVFSAEGLSVKPYWQLPFGEPVVTGRSLANWTEDLQQVLLDATRIRLRADVPVGTYLSGGIDSTYISSMVKRNFNNALCTFSVSFEDEQFDESSYQTQAVNALETDHRTIRCSAQDIGETFPQIIWHTETPLLRTAPTPLYQLSRLVRKNNYKVVLTGEGADEIFAGYNIFKEDKVRRFWARFPDSEIRPRLLERLYPYIFEHKNGNAKAFLKRFFKQGLEMTESPAYSHLLRWRNTSQLKNFFTPEIQKDTENLSQFIDRYASMLPPDFMAWAPLSRAQYTESSIFLPNYLLSSQGDRMAMANSIEGRYPFLDHRVVELACRIPPRLRMNGLCEKFILKQAACDTIPSSIVKRAKQPYRAPISSCFFGDSRPAYVNELLSENALKQTGYFDHRKVLRLIKKAGYLGSGALSERENMALVGILSTQLSDYQFIHNFPPYSIYIPKQVNIFH